MKDKTKILILSIDLIILILLCLYVWNDSKKYSCNECEITFKSKISGISGDYNKEINAKPNEILNSLNEGKCYVIWDRTNGWMLNG